MGHWRNHLELWISSYRASQLRRGGNKIVIWPHGKEQIFYGIFEWSFGILYSLKGCSHCVNECVKLMGRLGEGSNPGKHRDWGGLERSKHGRAESRRYKKCQLHVSHWSVLLWGPVLCLITIVCPAFLLTCSCLFSVWCSLFSVWQRCDPAANFKLG